MKRVEIPASDWHIALADAVRKADDETIIVVSDIYQENLAHSAAERMGKRVKVEIVG